MIIKKDSWHYKAVDMVFDNISSSLCLYFWQVVSSCLYIPTMLIVAGILLFTVGNVLLYPVLQVVISTDPILAFLSGILWIVVGIIVRNVLKDQDLLGKPLWESDPFKEQPILVAYIAAKKQKICPTLEFK